MAKQDWVPVIRALLRDSSPQISPYAWKQAGVLLGVEDLRSGCSDEVCQWSGRILAHTE